MKVNFYDSFKDFDGLPLQINGEMQIVGRIVAQCLFNGTGIRPSGNQQTDADKEITGIPPVHTDNGCRRGN